MIQKALTNRRMVYNITKFIITITFILVALISFGCSSDDGGSSAPVDSDGDGIIDSEDSCPNTPPGNIVDENGCTTPRFTDMGDGTILDNESGLFWLKNANSFGILSWHDGMDAVANLRSGEYGLSDGSMVGDWRIPTKGEWEAFFHPDYSDPPISNTIGDEIWTDGDAFLDIRNGEYYWSGTTTAADNNDAWLVYLSGDGLIFTYIKTSPFYIWAVR